MSETANNSTPELKRGDKQLVALKYMNTLEENYSFEDLTKAVGEETGLDEPGARHLIRYMVKFQDRFAPGKTKTLRQQGRIIAPSWYTPVAIDPNYSADGSEVYKAHMAAVHELTAHGNTPQMRPADSVTYLDFPLKKPAGRKSPVTKTEKTETKVKAPTENRATPERRAAIAAAFKNFSAKKTTKQVEELAKAGAHRFGDTTTTEVSTPAAASEMESAD